MKLPVKWDIQLGQLDVPAFEPFENLSSRSTPVFRSKRLAQ